MRPRFFNLHTILISTVLSLAVRHLHGDGLDQLQWRNPYPTGNDLVGVAFGGGLFVAVDSAGYVLSTVDGVSWQNGGSSTVKNPKALIHAGGKFVVTGENGGIATSEDAIVWTAQASGTTQGLASVAHANGVFVAVGAGATVLSSPDAVTWTLRTTSLNPAMNFHGVAFASGRFVAINNGPDLYTSEDGGVWTKRTIPGMLSHVGIVSDGDTFMVDAWTINPGGSPYPRPWTSTNGLDWVQRGSFSTLHRKLFAGGVFFAPNVNAIFGTNYGIATSPDALVWTPRILPAADLVIRDIAYGNGIYLAVGGFGAGASGAVVKSADTVDWVMTSSGDRSFSSSDAAYGAGKYVLVGSTILTSTDGQTFQRIDGIASNLTAVTYASGGFVAVGAGGTLIRSQDGTAWSRLRSGTLKRLNAIAYGAGRWVAVGSGGEIRVSTDGLLWDGKWSGTDYSLNAVVYAQGKFVIVGQNGIILSSTDGSSWSPQFSDSLGTLTDIDYGNGKFVAVGESIMTSADGAAWTGQAGPGGFNRISFGDGIFAATSTNARGLMTSADGVNWEVRNTPIVTPVGIAFLENTFLLFGGNGSILQSTPVGASVLSAFNNTATGTLEVTVRGGQVGGTYHLQSCTNLSTKAWSDAATFVQTHPVTVVRVPGGVGAPQCYYRAVAAP